MSLDKAGMTRVFLNVPEDSDLDWSRVPKPNLYGGGLMGHYSSKDDWFIIITCGIWGWDTAKTSLCRNSQEI